ncbi:hypothetical protein [Bacteriovorax sp. Seq25_V]|uniref:hypothetical protein n=1 Tax=Bacteriovorax sp. Seq25_V TaxID=1201288 RepID=UPI00038A0C31|nr:hypothetical protein [Bacteriovorax sp. Seq25_V]EQC47527.1 hypothetical protein M900_0663 [Bacteriovorax sp. Seq25_V]
MENIFGWSVLTIILVYLTYMAFSIKNETKVALATGKEFRFGGLLFNIPLWWTETFSSDEKYIFERTDTRYDWRATFLKYNFKLNETQNLQDVFESYAIEKKLVFDEENVIIKVPENIISFSDIGVEALRIEGTATQDDEHRLYIDILIFKNADEIFIVESKSSILNGLLEGPFFEQMIANITK